MKWLDRLEQKYSKYAIHNLMQYIVSGMAIVFVFDMLNNGVASKLGFSLTSIMHGEIWRIVTFIFVPRTSSPIFIIFSLMIMFFYGRVLEQSWGRFKFNFYYLIGTLGTIIANIIVEAMFGFQYAYPLNNFYLYMSLLLAVAHVIPDYEIRVYFILPVKLKYLGYIYGGILFFQFLFSSNVERIVILFSLLNYFIFFGGSIIRRLKKGYRKQQYHQAHKPKASDRVKKRSTSGKSAVGNGQVIQVAFHCCEVCGKTEVDDPTLEFRFCSKCDGRHEYCSDHILDHVHQ